MGSWQHSRHRSNELDRGGWQAARATFAPSAGKRSSSSAVSTSNSDSTRSHGMPLTNIEDELRVIARECIASGRLPCDPALQMWGGYGTDQLCSLCGAPIQRDEIEYEVQVKGGRRELRFHMLCQSVWQLECARDDYLKKHP